MMHTACAMFFGAFLFGLIALFQKRCPEWVVIALLGASVGCAILAG